MWHWDQGRLDYFQFDVLRKIARFAIKHDLKRSVRETLVEAVGRPFLPDDPRYKPWRNYSRIFQLAMIVVPDQNGGAKVTRVGKLLADDGRITSDDYFHFLAQATTDPSPALKSWDSAADIRYPLLFVLRFLLARATQDENTTRIDDVVNAYESTGFRGDEDQIQFLDIIHHCKTDASGRRRQASESIQVLAQISYLSATASEINVSLSKTDAGNLFCDLKPVEGNRLASGADEILRIADLFPSAMADIDLNYSDTIVSDVEEAGFSEGGRVKRAHLAIERNWKIRSEFFKANPGGVCDFCDVDTKRRYPWTSGILDIHHLLPLCSGTRTSADGTTLQDLVANCPTCHRAVHRYYDEWLREKGRRDFIDAVEAKRVYREAKSEHRNRGEQWQ